jgi:hydrogenase nickel incorporation protein HypB
MSHSPRMVEVRVRILKENDLLARQLRERFEEAGVAVVSFVSSPGSGKTAFLESLMACMSKNWRVAALVVDLAT